MSRLEDVVRESLAAHEAGAPEPGALLHEVHQRARRHRRRDWAAAGLAAAAVAAVVLGIVAVVPAGGARVRPASTPSPETGVPRGLQAISYHGVQVLVPASWRVDDARCGTPQHDTVLIEDGSPVPLCDVAQPPGLTVVRMTLADSPLGAARSALATDLLTVDGQPAHRGAGTLPGQHSPLQVLVLPTVDVVVSVESPDGTQAARILDTAQIVPVDAYGCVDRMRSFGLAATAVRPGADAKLVPGRPVSASICRYSAGWLARSVRLDATDLDRLVDLLNALPAGVSEPGPGFWEDATRCAADESRAFVLQFTYPAGARLTVVVRLGGCRWLSATNGARTTKISPGLGQFLLDAVGYDGVLPDFRTLR